MTLLHCLWLALLAIVLWGQRVRPRWWHEGHADRWDAWLAEHPPTRPARAVARARTAVPRRPVAVITVTWWEEGGERWFQWDQDLSRWGAGWGSDWTPGVG